jgi:hypothetical protein
MDASPEKAYYLPLPHLPQLQVPDLPRLRVPRLPRLRARDLSSIVRRSLWRPQPAHTKTETRVDPIPEKFYYVPLPLLVRPHVRELAATIGRGRRERHGSRRGAEAWASHTPDARVVKRWWASHTPEAVAWMLAITSAVLVGMLVARF